jgi:membrane-bound lytic murein transglycosylase MltF
MWWVPLGLSIILIFVFSVGMLSGPRTTRPRSSSLKQLDAANKNIAANATNAVTVAQAETGMAPPDSFSVDANKNSEKLVNAAKEK